MTGYKKVPINGGSRYRKDTAMVDIAVHCGSTACFFFEKIFVS